MSGADFCKLSRFLRTSWNTPYKLCTSPNFVTPLKLSNVLSDKPYIYIFVSWQKPKSLLRTLETTASSKSVRLLALYRVTFTVFWYRDTASNKDRLNTHYISGPHRRSGHVDDLYNIKNRCTCFIKENTRYMAKLHHDAIMCIRTYNDGSLFLIKAVARNCVQTHQRPTA